MAQRQRFQLQFQALCRVTGKPCGTDIVCLLRRNIGKHADDALTAQGQDRHNLVIVARINVQFLATQGCNIRNLGDIAAGFLYSVYIGQLGKLRQCGGLQIHTGTGRNIVNDAGQGNGICNGRIVGNQARLAGFVVIRGNQQQGICTGFLGLFGDLNGKGRIVGARARNNRNALCGMLHSKTDALHMLFVAERCGFTRGAADHNGIRAVCNLIINNAAQFLKVDGSVCVHGGNDGNSSTGKYRLFHRECFSFNLGDD